MTNYDVNVADGCLPVLAVAALMGLGPLAIPVVLFLLLGAGAVALLRAGYDLLRDALRSPTDRAAR